MLTFIPPNFLTSAAAMESARQCLETRWGPDINFILAARQDRSGAKPLVKYWNSYAKGILSIFSQDAYFAYSGVDQVAKLNACLDSRPDLVFAHRLWSMCPLLRTERPLPPIFFDLDDVEHISYYRRVVHFPEWKRERLKIFQVPALLRGELQAIRRARRTFVCSNRDREHLTRFWRLPRVATIENSVAIPDVPAAEDGHVPTLMFLGNLQYAPNAVGAEFLVSQVWPRVRAALPQAELIVAGEAPEGVKSHAAPPPGVHFPGFVRDLQALYRRTTVVCCPILSGGGTRIKIVEAAANGKAIVSTTIGAEGLDLVEGQEIVRRDDPQLFADACVWLLRDVPARRRLAQAARAAAIRLYDRQAVIEKIKREIRAGLAEVNYTQGSNT